MKSALILSLAIFGVLSVHSVSGSSLEERHFGGGLLQSLANLDPRRQQEDKNKKAVLDLMNELFGNKNIDILDKYVSSEKYIQHSPNMPDGLESIKAFANRFFKDLPKEKTDIKRIAADGDLVWVHWKWNWQGKPNAFVDIFRFENGKIVEHWDVIQEVPEKSANDHPMF